MQEIRSPFWHSVEQFAVAYVAFVVDPQCARVHQVSVIANPGWSVRLFGFGYEDDL